MSEPFKQASVIIVTYNRPDALARVLLGLDEQTADAFEVVVADDGSTKGTRQVVDELRDQLSYPLKYVWQEDRGFRGARARNVAVLESVGDYLIFLDGDCIPMPDFVDGHRWLSEREWFVTGKRIKLGQRFTARVLSESLPVTRWPFWKWVIAKLRGDVYRSIPIPRFRTPAFRKRVPQRLNGCKTCNLAMWRSDFLRVDGFDENYIGWGFEDIDLVARLFGAGVYRKEGNFAIPVLHLWHPEESRSLLRQNKERWARRRAAGAVRAEVGISTHLRT